MYPFRVHAETDWVDERKPFNIALGQQIAMLRKKRKITQSQLAERLGFNRQQLSRIENGKVEIQASLLPKVATELGCMIRDIVDAVELEPPEPMANTEERSKAKQGLHDDIGDVEDLSDLKVLQSIMKLIKR